MPEKRHWRMYEAYGLNIRSAVPLNELPNSTATRADVVVGYGRAAAWTAKVPERSHAIEIVDGEARMWFPELGGVTVKGGKRITVYLNGGAAKSYLRLYVQGMVLAMLLHQRGMCVLHASVVEIEGRTIALMGPMGAGKSSLAGGLYARGHRVVADDNAAVVLSNGAATVASAYPYVKLFPSIASVLGFESGSLSALHESQSKVAGRVSDRFSASPATLSAIYVLDRDHAPDISRLPALQATVELVRNSVPTRWGHPGDGGQLKRCADVARQVPAFAVRTFSDLEGLPAVISSVEQHCLREFGSGGVVQRSMTGGAYGF